MGTVNLLDIVKQNGGDPLVGLFDETTKAHPELTVIPSRTMSGIGYKISVRTSLGTTTGSFRKANSGVTPNKAIYAQRDVGAYILNPIWEADEAVAQAAQMTIPDYLAQEAAALLEAEWVGVGKAMFYGTNSTHGNADAFPGFLQCYDSTNMVVDAGGTTATTGSSVWFVRATPDKRNVAWSWGNDGNFNMNGFPTANKQLVVDPNDSTKRLYKYNQGFTAWLGLQIPSYQSICRIKKLTADSTKTLTDTMINTALSKFPAGKGPTAIFMSRRSMMQLTSARTATSPTGNPAPWVQTILGMDGSNIPVYVTESISDVEALTL
jgi:hypothetical protein